MAAVNPGRQGRATPLTPAKARGPCPAQSDCLMGTTVPRGQRREPTRLRRTSSREWFCQFAPQRRGPNCCEPRDLRRHRGHQKTRQHRVYMRRLLSRVANEHGSRVHNVLFRDEPRWRTTTPRNDTSRDDSREYDHCATMAELLDLETLDVGFVDASQSCRGLSRQQQVSSSAPRSSHDERPHLHVLFSVLIGRGGAGGRWSK